jgi:hypothetical protein
MDLGDRGGGERLVVELGERFLDEPSSRRASIANPLTSATTLTTMSTAVSAISRNLTRTSP